MRATSKSGLLRRWIAIGVLVGAVASLAVAGLVVSATTVDTAAANVCQAAVPVAAEFGSINGVLRSETSNAQAVADWQEQRHPDRAGLASSFRADSSGTVVTVCLYSGEFVTPVGPPALDGTPKPPHTVLRLLVEGSNVTLDAAGYPGALDPETPGDFTRATQ